MGERTFSWASARRNVAMVFQGYALYPHPSVAQPEVRESLENA